MKTIFIEDKILLVDETAEVKGTILVDGKIIGKVIKQYDNLVEVDLGWTTTQTKINKDCIKIIAAYPSISGCLEFETLPPKEDDVKLNTLARIDANEVWQKGDDREFTGHFVGFKQGYKLAKSETMFNLDAMEKCWNDGCQSDNGFFGTFKLFIESLTKPKEYEFIVEEEHLYLYPDGNLSKISRLAPNAIPIVQPKIVNNKIQGKWKTL